MRIIRFCKEKKPPSVSFITSCWERDWELLLKREHYLEEKMIGNHHFPFERKILIINNVSDLCKVKKEADKLIAKGTLTEVYIAEEWSEKVLHFFGLKKSDFKAADERSEFQVESSWVYYNAIAPLTGIYHTDTDYLIYHTGDVWLPQKVDWIPKAIKQMEKHPVYKVANLVWNEKTGEVKKESYKKRRGFFVAKQGFSDQLFLVKREDFREKIYHEIRPDSHHYPRGDVFEKRVFSYMKNHDWERITFAKGTYFHECFEKLNAI
ncbi:MAG TPA: hypothetical protein VLG44_05120 [Chlamydiales bacterium]|nr:hypothetical protein [Chlamydiales bacterium]